MVSRRQLHACPVTECNRSYQAAPSLFQHINVHLSNQDDVPNNFFNDFKRVVCNSCNKNFAVTRKHYCMPNTTSVTTNMTHAANDSINANSTNVNNVLQTSSSSDNIYPSHDLETIFQHFQRGTVIYRIPKASRIQTAKALQTLITDVCETNTVDLWIKLLCFPSRCLFKPKTSKRRSQSLSSIINKQIALYLSQSNMLTDDFDSVLDLHDREPNDSNEKRAKLAQRKIEKGDVRGAIRILSSDDNVLPNTEDTVNKLAQKHPPRPPNTDMPAFDPTEHAITALQCDEAQVRRAISSFAPGSASGPDLLEPQHLKDLTAKSCGEPGSRLLEAITKLCNLMLNGKVPIEVTPFLYGSSLFALSKQNNDVRPIAVGTVYRRLTSKIAAKDTVKNVKHLLYPNQMGVGSPKGAEAIIHTIRNFLRNRALSQEPFCYVKS